MSAPSIRAQETPADPYEALAKYEFGQSRLPLAMIDEEIRKTPRANFRAVEAKLLSALKAPATTKDAKRFICRWLSIVGSSECIPAVADLLADETLSHPARIALEPMPAPAAGAALRAALPKVKGKLLVGVISSIGVRRDGEAVGALAGLAGESDPQVAVAAISALGEIASVEAARALEGLETRVELARPLARAKIAAANGLMAAGKGDEAVRIFRAAMQPQQPRAIRTAALKGLIGGLARPEAVKLIVEMMQGDDSAIKTATLAAYLSSTDNALKNAVAEQIPAMKPAAQLTMLGMLADQQDVAARPAVLKVLESAAAVEARVAALECLARHGEAADVLMLVRLAHSDPAPVAEAARNVLQRMGKPGVDEALVGLIESRDAAERAVVLTALAARRVDSALPALVRLLGATDTAVAVESARALGVLGKNEQLLPLAAALVRTDSAELRSATAEAVKSICSRATDKEAAVRPLLAALDQAKTRSARTAILQLMIYTRGQEALAAVRKAIQSDDGEVRETAFRTLVAWPEASATPYLIEFAQTAEKPSYAILALRDGCLRLAGMNETPMVQRLDIYRSVLDVAKRADEKKQAIAGLASLPAPGAMDLLLASAKNAELKGDALVAAVRLAKVLGLAYPKRTKAALDEIKSQGPSADVLRAVEEAMKSLENAGQSPDGFILAWMLSGPFQDQNKPGSELFDVAMPPEKSAPAADWRPVALQPNSSGMVQLGQILGGDNRVAYLRTQITSSKEQDAVLSVGSDDGVKIWLGGQVVHGNNAVRGCTADQDKVTVKLKQGANVLLVKVCQDGGGWEFCCRLRSADGKPLDGVTVAPNE